MLRTRVSATLKQASMLAAMIALGTGSLAGQDSNLRPDKRSAFATGSAGAGIAAAGRTEYAVRRVTADIHVDARLDEPGWAMAVPIVLAWETAPGDNEPAPVRTECHLAYDKSALYLGCRAYDPGVQPPKFSPRAHPIHRPTSRTR